MILTQEEKDLLEQLRSLQKKLSKDTLEKYKRLNPFYEDLTPWSDRANQWTNGTVKNLTIYNSSTLIGDVQLGDNTWVGPFTMLDGTGGLSIGKYCSISTGVHIFTHDTVNWALSGGACNSEVAPVNIGDCCFIGTQAIILKGVTIGHHCVVGAGTVVTKSFPDFSIIVGNPGKIAGVVKLKDGKITLVWN